MPSSPAPSTSTPSTSSSQEPKGHATAQAHRLEGQTLAHVLARYEADGYRGQFGARPGGEVLCFTCHGTSLAGDVHVHRLGRVEGASDPGAEAVVGAIICPLCTAKGTLVLGYGPSSPPEDGEVLLQLHDRRPAMRAA